MGNILDSTLPFFLIVPLHVLSLRHTLDFSWLSLWFGHLSLSFHPISPIDPKFSWKEGGILKLSILQLHSFLASTLLVYLTLGCSAQPKVGVQLTLGK